MFSGGVSDVMDVVCSVVVCLMSWMLCVQWWCV